MEQIEELDVTERRKKEVMSKVKIDRFTNQTIITNTPYGKQLVFASTFDDMDEYKDLVTDHTYMISFNTMQKYRNLGKMHPYKAYEESHFLYRSIVEVYDGHWQDAEFHDTINSAILDKLIIDEQSDLSSLDATDKQIKELKQLALKANVGIKNLDEKRDIITQYDLYYLASNWNKYQQKLGKLKLEKEQSMKPKPKKDKFNYDLYKGFIKQ